MNKYLFIGIIVVVITLVVGLWVYLLFNGTPSATGDIFSNLGFTEPAPERPAVILDTPPTTVDTSSQMLSQLTTRPVAGFTAVNTASSSVVVYAEKGTGHIYQIDLLTGLEGRISGTTLSRVVEAVFNKTGTQAVLTTETDYEHRSYLAEIGTSTNADLIELPDNTKDHFFQEDSLFYTKIENNKTIGYQFSPIDQSATKVFETPLTDIKIYWQGGDVYLINRPAPKLRGAIYQISQDGQYQKIYGPEYGLTAFSDTESSWIVSYIDTEAKQYRSYSLDTGTGEKTELALAMIPEKCTQTEVNTTWCVLPFLSETSPSYLTNWYQGIPAGTDMIWQINISTGEAVLVLDLLGTAGFAIDAEAVTVVGNKLFFTNRHNDTLWSYDTQ